MISGVFLAPGRRWTEAERRDRDSLLNFTLFSLLGEQSLVFDHLGTRIAVDFLERNLKIFIDGGWEPLDHPILEMVTLVYLGGVRAVYPLGKDIVSCRDLKESHFFNGIHAFDLEGLIERYGKDPKDFAGAAKRLGGEPLPMADEAYRLLPFPRVPLYYLLWCGDDEFEPRISVLMDRSIEQIFQADAIWALVNLASMELLNAG
jgi:hypothetical protein